MPPGCGGACWGQILMGCAVGRLEAAAISADTTGALAKLAPDVHAALLPLVLQTVLAEEAGQDLATSFGQRAADLMDSCLEGGWQTLCICSAAQTCTLQRCPIVECRLAFQLWGACPAPRALFPTR